MKVHTKPCASCGSPVADSALRRGAAEDAAGRRYCAPCVAKLLKSDSPEAEAIRNVYRPPSSVMIPSPKPATPPAPARPAASGHSPRALKSTRKLRRRRSSKAGRPARPTTRRRPLKAAGQARPRAPETPPKAAPPADPPPVRRPPSSAVRREPARKASSARVKPAPRRPAAADTGRNTSVTRRVSRRTGAHPALPWYFRLSRAQLIAAICAVAGLVLIVAIVAVVASSRRRVPVQIPTGPVRYSSQARRILARADRLAAQGKKQEAIRALQEALEEAKRIPDTGERDKVSREITRKLYGLRFKTPGMH